MKFYNKNIIVWIKRSYDPHIKLRNLIMIKKDTLPKINWRGFDISLKVT